MNGDGNKITLEFNEDLSAAPAKTGFDITIGDNTYSDTFISGIAFDQDANGDIKDKLVISLQNLPAIADNNKVYVSYTGSDLKDTANNVFAPFVESVNPSGSDKAVADLTGITATAVNADGNKITLTFNEDIKAAPAKGGFDITIGDNTYSDAFISGIAVSYTHLTLPTKRIV